MRERLPLTPCLSRAPSQPAISALEVAVKAEKVQGGVLSGECLPAAPTAGLVGDPAAPAGAAAAAVADAVPLAASAISAISIA